MTASRRLGQPRPTSVKTGSGGLPTEVGGAPVDSRIEDWLVEDRWWTAQPIRRRYFELVLDDGRCIVVFKDLIRGCWFSQRD